MDMLFATSPSCAITVVRVTLGVIFFAHGSHTGGVLVGDEVRINLSFQPIEQCGKPRPYAHWLMQRKD
jgi:hypothetical protein